MYVRILGQQEILNALHLVWEVFAQDIIPECSNEGIEEFQRYIKYDNIMPKVQSGEYIFFGAWDGDKLYGVSTLQSNGHISLFFVKKEKQRQGVGRMLLLAMCQHLLRVSNVRVITVHAVPSAVEAYRRWGMYAVSEEQVENGVTYIPMEMQIPEEMLYAKPKKKRTWIWVLIIGLFVLLSLIGGMLFFRVVKVIQNDRDSFIQEFDEFYNDEELFEDGYDETEEAGGMEAIPEYVEENLSYELGEESYILTPEEAGMSRTTIAFEIYYPQLTGKEGSVQEKINEELKACAMETAERIYFNPTDEIKEKVLGEEYPVLMSYVEYKVTYMTEDLISVVYQDYYYEGSEQDYYLELRTRNISLKDGTVYEVKDIIKLNDHFIKEWADVMREEAHNDKLISELNKQEMIAILSGEEMDGVYKDNFFLDAEGMEIGLSFKYPADDENNTGYYWVTAPFEWDDMKEFETNSNFWELVK